MILFATCFVLLGIASNIECIRPKSVNVALETVFGFEEKDVSANVKLIDDVQNFLTKVKKVVNYKAPQRRTIEYAKTVKFTEFLKELVNVLKSYQNDDLEEIFAVIDDEAKKYHSKGFSLGGVYELVRDHSRRTVANKQNKIKEEPADIIRKNLEAISKFLDDAKDSKRSDILDYVDSLYTSDDGLEFSRIIENFKSYKYKFNRANADLVKLVKDSLRFVISDHYSGLNVHTRRNVKERFETLFRDILKILDNITDRHWTVKHTKVDKKENNNVKVRKTKTISHEKKENYKHQARVSKKLKDWIPERFGTTNDEEKLFDEEDASRDQTVSTYEENIDSRTEVTIKSKHHHKHRFSTSLPFIKAFVKHKEVRNYGDRSNKHKHLTKKLSEYVTLYPEVTTVKHLKKIKKKDKHKMQTLWQEIDERQKVAYGDDSDIKHKNKNDFKRKTKKRKHKLTKHRDNGQKYGIMIDRNSLQKKKEPLKTMSDEEHEIRFILTGGQKKSPLHPSALRTGKIKNYTADESTDNNTDTTTKRYKQKHNKYQKFGAIKQLRQMAHSTPKRHRGIKVSTEENTENKKLQKKVKTTAKNISVASQKYETNPKSIEEIIDEEISSTATKQQLRKKLTDPKYSSKHKTVENSTQELSTSYEEKAQEELVQKYNNIEESTEVNNGNKPKKDTIITKTSDEVSTSQSNQESEDDSSTEESATTDTKESMVKTFTQMTETSINDEKDERNRIAHMRVSMKTENKTVQTHKLAPSEEGMSIETNEKQFQSRRGNINKLKETKNIELSLIDNQIKGNDNANTNNTNQTDINKTKTENPHPLVSNTTTKNTHNTQQSATKTINTTETTATSNIQLTKNNTTSKTANNFSTKRENVSAINDFAINRNISVKNTEGGNTTKTVIPAMKYIVETNEKRIDFSAFNSKPNIEVKIKADAVKKKNDDFDDKNKKNTNKVNFKDKLNEIPVDENSK